MKMKAGEGASETVRPTSTPPARMLGRSLASLQSNVALLGDEIERIKASQNSLTSRLRDSEEPVTAGIMATLDLAIASEHDSVGKIDELNRQLQRDLLIHKETITLQQQKLQELTEALARAEQHYGIDPASAQSAVAKPPGFKECNNG